MGLSSDAIASRYGLSAASRDALISDATSPEERPFPSVWEASSSDRAWRENLA